MEEKKEPLQKISKKRFFEKEEQLPRKKAKITINEEKAGDELLQTIKKKPIEIKYNIVSYSQDVTKQLKEFALFNKFFNQGFQGKYRDSVLVPKLIKYSELSEENNKVINILNKYPKYMNVELLLHCIACGNQDMAQKIIEEHPECLLQRGSVTDFSGRTFKNIAPYELGLYYFDTHMLDMMHESVSKVEDLAQQKQILIQLQKQYKTVITDFNKEKKTGGVHYTLNGEKCHEMLFDLQTLIDVLQTYINNYDNWDVDQCIKHWCTVVGKLQTLLPAHVRQEYCRPDRSFYPTPDFKEKTLKRCLQFYNWIQNEYQYWGCDVTGLGVDFGIGRRDGGKPRGAVAREVGGGCLDLLALKSLFKTRKEQIFDLKGRLDSSIQKLDEEQNSRKVMY